jgi:hypothetical protein
MPSPFPGMNPYLEQEEVWHDFHDSFLPLARDFLNAQVGADYIVKIGDHIYIHDRDEEGRALLGRADVTVANTPRSASPPSSVGVIESPAKVRLPAVEVERACFLEIRDRRSRQLITVLELLSPANKKPGKDREQYIDKRNQLLATTVHLVEIDLLRGGPRMPFEDLPPCDYYVLVSRVEQRLECELWPLTLRDPLPEIPIPLRESDADLRLNIQELLHRVYDAAGYAKYIYDGAPVPPLSPEDAAWARTLLS